MGIFSKRRKSRYSSGNPLLRWFGPGATTLGVLYAAFMLLSGNWSFSSLDETSPDLVRPEPIRLGEQSDRPADRIRIATFNIERFGETKSTKRNSKSGIDVLEKIAQIIARFDLVAIQELQGAEGKALARLIELLNVSGATYSGQMSEPIGEQGNSYRESYGFVWDRSRIELVPGSSYVVRDPGGRMHREPMVATFQVRLPAESRQQPFRFTVINVHTDPDKVDPRQPDNEINVLADVFHRVREFEFNQSYEDDFILLGDLNVESKDLGELKAIRGMYSVAGDIGTNVRQTKTNDHILIDRSVTQEYAEGRMGVIDFVDDLKLTEQQAEEISDHLPLWAEFGFYEQSVAQERSASADIRTFQ